MGERILTLHPSEGKLGVNIDKARYDRIRGAILKILEDKSEITFSRLLEEVQQRLFGDFNGSISWYVTTVKLDLEARQEIERIPGSKPQRLRLKRIGS